MSRVSVLTVWNQKLNQKIFGHQFSRDHHVRILQIASILDPSAYASNNLNNLVCHAQKSFGVENEIASEMFVRCARSQNGSVQFFPLRPPGGIIASWLVYHYMSLQMVWIQELCYKYVNYDHPCECSPEKDCLRLAKVIFTVKKIVERQ